MPVTSPAPNAEVPQNIPSDEHTDGHKRKPKWADKAETDRQVTELQPPARSSHAVSLQPEHVDAMLLLLLLLLLLLAAVAVPEPAAAAPWR